ncbi:ABC transporter ATP-binding protein [Alkalibaculum sporogenes]|nr:ABC transporter ATP-binding protein [Alkalibaculum sporogenes]
MKYIGKYKFLLSIVVICLFINSFAMIAGSYFLKPIINDYILPGDFNGLGKMLIILGSIYACGAAASYGYSRIMVHISQKTVFVLRRDLFHKMQDLSLKYFDTHTNGDLMSRYTNDIDTISEAINNSFAGIISNVVMFVGVIVMMLVLNPFLTVITLIIVSVMLFVSQKIGKKSKFYFSEQQAKLGSVNGYIEEMIEGQKVIKVFSYEENAKNEFKNRNEALRIAATSAQSYSGSMMPIMINLSYINYAITSCVGAIMVIRGMLDIGSLVSFLQYTRQVSQPINHLAQQVNTILAALSGAERIFEVMEEKAEIDEGTVSLTKVIMNKDGSMIETDKNTDTWAWRTIDEFGNISLIPLKGDVRFENVVFGYNDDDKVLKDISLFAKPGQKIAFVGSTGAGKTTITNLINRFYEIKSGRITYDGIDIRYIKKDSLRSSLGVVLQDTHLFTGTISDNIRYGRLDATDDEVVEAAKLANAHNFIKYLPLGYKTMLTSDGGNLSQGQRQLMSIARAAVANPPVLILDEATSSIDTRTEKFIEEGMDSLMANRTVFVIAHRLSTVRNSEAIMVLEQGEIIERGSHEDLLANEGRYYQLHTGQFELE